MTLLCLDGPHAGLVCEDSELNWLIGNGVPDGYIKRDAEWFDGLHYPASLTYEPNTWATTLPGWFARNPDESFPWWP